MSNRGHPTRRSTVPATKLSPDPTSPGRAVTWIHPGRPDCPRCEDHQKVYEWDPGWICVGCKLLFEAAER